MTDAAVLQAEDSVDATGGPERPRRSQSGPVLAQREIDALTNRAAAEEATGRPAGVRSMIDAGASPREAMPMLRVAIERGLPRVSGRLRAFFGSDVEVSFERLSSVRYGEYLDGLLLPTQTTVFRAEGWDGSGLVTIGPELALVILDSLLGAERGPARSRPASRPFTAIECALFGRLVAIVLAEVERSFALVAPASFPVERVETDPRLANIARPGDAAVLVALRLDLGSRSATLDILVPYATLEPVRAALLQDDPGEKLGRDELWSSHLATQLWQAGIEARAVLHETRLPLGRMLNLAVGDTLMFDLKPTDLVEVRCGDVLMTRGRIGRVDGQIAIQIVEPLRQSSAQRDAASQPTSDPAR